jgi:hypothetical protein
LFVYHDLNEPSADEPATKCGMPRPPSAAPRAGAAGEITSTGTTHHTYVSAHAFCRRQRAHQLRYACVGAQVCHQFREPHNQAGFFGAYVRSAPMLAMLILHSSLVAAATPEPRMVTDESASWGRAKWKEIDDATAAEARQRENRRSRGLPPLHCQNKGRWGAIFGRGVSPSTAEGTCAQIFARAEGRVRASLCAGGGRANY